jgi:hypothetical protein
MDLFVGGFSSTLFPSLLIGRFRAREPDIRRAQNALAKAMKGFDDWVLGGGAACLQLTEYYRGDDLVMYLIAPPPELPKRLALVRDASGPIALANAPGPLALAGPALHTAHPLLVYTDLLSLGHERARDAAREVHERYLEGQG